MAPTSTLPTPLREVATWSEFAGSGAHTWLVIAAFLFFVYMVVRAIVHAPYDDTPTSMDLRQRGLDPVDGGLEADVAVLIETLDARAERLGYQR